MLSDAFSQGQRNEDGDEQMYASIVKWHQGFGMQTSTWYAGFEIMIELAV